MKINRRRRDVVGRHLSSRVFGANVPSVVALELRLLGPLEIVEEEKTLALPGEKPRALLIALALRAGEVVSTDELAEALWEGSPPATAAATLQMHVAKLRKTLGREAIVTEPPGYRLALSTEAIDAYRFERRLVAGRTALRRGDGRRAARVLSEALALWRGQALADVAYADFAQAERRRLEELRLDALEERIDADLAGGRDDELVGELEALVSEHPLRERLRGQLMLALYRSGRQAEALEAYKETRRAFVEELGIDPSPELKELHRRILNQDPQLAAEASEARGPRLPVPATALVGRGEELARIAALLTSSEARLVTLTGPGGIGKTRLALELAHRADDELAGGALFLSLASVRDPELVLAEIARACGVSEAGDTPLAEAIAARLAEPTLIVLDNFEQVVEAAGTVAALIAAAPSLRVLVTSRERLRVRGEHELALEPLAPEEAVDLFVARADDAGIALERTTALAELCAHLDNLPLALELAAARLKLLSPAQILERISGRLDLLKGGRDADPRQRTLRATIEWSYDLLTPEEQQLFARLSVFAGSCTLEAAEEVADAELDTLQSLLEKSLVRFTGERYRMLETILEYAGERLEESNEAYDVRERHCSYFEELARRARAERDAGAEPERAINRVESEHANLRVALDWASMSDGSRFAALILTLAGFWRETQHLRELRSLLARALDELRPEEQELETRCRCWLGLSLIALGELDRAREALELSVAWWRGRGVNDDRDLAVALLGLGTVDLEQAAVEGAESLFLEARDVASRAGADGVVLSATGNLATVAERRGDDARAVELFTSVVESARRQGDVASEAWALSNIGLLSHESGALELAERSLWESLELFDRLGWVEGLAYSLTGLAAVALELGDEARALKLAGAAEGLAESIGLGWQGAERELRDRVRAAIRESLGDFFEEVWATAVQGDAGATVAGEIARLPSRSH